ncbi:MAG: ArnT family glycosyltransferase [Terriglobia bacterium]
MRSEWRVLLLLFAAIFGVLLVLHAPFLRLPYFWDEAGYYIPAALDFYRHHLLIPHDTLPTGHTPLVMIYLGAVWRLFGFGTLATRTAMILIAAAAVLVTFLLGRRVAGTETGLWSALLLALSPLFFAQSSLVFLDLTAALFTTLAVLFILDERWLRFAVAASAALMSKETAVVMLPVVWAFLWPSRKERRKSVWLAALAPLAPLAAWAVYYHHATGFWTGNATYLKYNLYATLTPLHILRGLLARLGEVFVQGFNWIATTAALLGLWRLRKQKQSMDEAASSIAPLNGASSLSFRGVAVSPELRREESRKILHFRARFLAELGIGLPGKRLRQCGGFLRGETNRRPGFAFLAIGLILVYLVMLSLVGGAILPRYLLPVFPVFYVGAATLAARLPRTAARALMLVAVACFISSWFINPPYPFPYEDNLAYSDFVRLHQQAANFLEALPGNPVILTAWPATDELRSPFLGYVTHPLRVAAVSDFRPADLRNLPHFDVLYLYSRQWDPGDNLLSPRSPLITRLRRFFEYRPAMPPRALATRFHLALLRQFTRRGQWVRIYTVEGDDFGR